MIDGLLRALEREPGHLDLTGFRQHEAAIAVDGPHDRLRDSAPHIDGEAVSGADNVVGADGHVERRHIGRTAEACGRAHAAVEKNFRTEAPQFFRRVRDLRIQVAQGVQIVGRGLPQHFGRVGDVRLPGGLLDAGCRGAIRSLRGQRKLRVVRRVLARAWHAE